MILYLKISVIFGYLITTQISVFKWYGQKIWKLEMRKKWNPKVLLLVNIIFKKYKEKGDFFNPEKADVEESYLNEHPYIRFVPVRHKKCLMSKQRPCLR